MAQLKGEVGKLDLFEFLLVCTSILVGHFVSSPKEKEKGKKNKKKRAKR